LLLVGCLGGITAYTRGRIILVDWVGRLFPYRSQDNADQYRGTIYWSCSDPARKSHDWRCRVPAYVL